jgi:hypothetical protein
MTEAKTATPSPARVQLPALGYWLLLAVLTAFGLHALFFSGPAMRIAAREQLEQAVAAAESWRSSAKSKSTVIAQPHRVFFSKALFEFD